MAGPSSGRFLRKAAVLLALQALPLVDAGVAMALTLTSSAFQPGGTIPSKYTCKGDDISPPLAIDGVPAGAKSLALIMDPDAPIRKRRSVSGCIGSFTITICRRTPRACPRMRARAVCPREPSLA